MQRLWQSFKVWQTAWIRSRAPETNLHDKKSEDHHKVPIIEEKNSKDEEQTQAEHSDETPSILEVDDKPAVQLDTPELSAVKNEKLKGSTKVKKDTPDARARSHQLRGRGNARRRAALR